MKVKFKRIPQWYFDKELRKYKIESDTAQYPYYEVVLDSFEGVEVCTICTKCQAHGAGTYLIKCGGERVYVHAVNKCTPEVRALAENSKGKWLHTCDSWEYVVDNVDTLNELLYRMVEQFSPAHHLAIYSTSRREDMWLSTKFAVSGFPSMPFVYGIARSCDYSELSWLFKDVRQSPAEINVLVTRDMPVGWEGSVLRKQLEALRRRREFLNLIIIYEGVTRTPSGAKQLSLSLDGAMVDDYIDAILGIWHSSI